MTEELSLEDLYRRRFRRELLLKKMEALGMPEGIKSTQRELLLKVDWDIKLRLDSLQKEMEQERADLDGENT